MRRIPVADVPERLARQEAFTPTPVRDIYSAEQHEYLDPVPGMQRKYADNATYNGSAALARLRGGEGG
jgi:hypothetical protein